MTKQSGRPEEAEFGDTLREYRQRRELTQAQLARKAGISVQSISYYESNKKRPRKNTCEIIADALELAPDERTTLLRKRVGIPPAHSPQEDQVFRSLKRALTLDVAEEFKEQLLGDVTCVIQEWRRVQTSLQDRGVRCLVVPSAGWQSDELPHDAMVKAVHRTIEEFPKMDSVYVVAAPRHRAAFAESLTANDSLRIKIIGQPDEKSGSGAAILAATRFLRASETIAIAYPDDRVDSTQALLDVFQRVRKPVVAVKEYEQHDEHTRGLVTLVKEEGMYRIARIEEKPGLMDQVPSDRFSVVGRYIATPSVLDILEEMKRRGETLGVTNAFEKLIVQKGRPVYACVYPPESVKSIHRLRSIHETLQDFFK